MRKLLLAGALLVLSATPVLAQETPPAPQGPAANSLDDFMPRGRTPSQFLPASCNPMFERNDTSGNISAVVIKCPDAALFAGIRYDTARLEGRPLPRSEWVNWNSNQPLFRVTRKS